jgi:hypothetical protein
MTFDPRNWLERFEAAGGGWYVADGKPNLCCLVGAKVAGLVGETYAPGHTNAVFAVILERDAAGTNASADA